MLTFKPKKMQIRNSNGEFEEFPAIGGATIEQIEQIETNRENIEKLQEQIADYLPKNQGASNVGKILVVGTDGNLVLTDIPEGSSGDITGVLDESNNLLLSGNLASGTYTLKYKNEDGTYSDAGSLVVGAIPNYTNILDVYEVKLNTRYSVSAGNYVSCTGMICMIIPLADVLNKTIRMKGFVNGLEAGGSGATWYVLDDSNTLTFSCYTNDGTSVIWKNTALTSDSDGVYGIDVKPGSLFHSSQNVSTGETLVMNLAVNESTSVTSLDGLIITIDEEING